MNTNLPPDHDDELPGETELAALYRKLPKSEPGPALDAAVLRAAAEAMADDNGANVTTLPRARNPRTRWLIPLSSAATLVLAAGLAWHMRSMPVVESVRTAAVPATVATPVDAPPASVAPVSPPPVAAPPPPAPAQPVRSEIILNEVAEAPRQPRPALRKLEQPDTAITAMKPQKVTADQDVVTTALPSIGARQAANEVAAAPPPQDAAAPSAESYAPSPVMEFSDAAADKAAAVSSEAEMPRAAPAPMAAPEPMAAPAPTIAGKLDVTEKDAGDTPAKELDKIRELFAEHRDAEAKARLKTFQHEHGDQALPMDLRARLRDHP